jgi:3,4-dihydroxy 2-butanone 4-phosphate synthase/GTP cyclohydrolase II
MRFAQRHQIKIGTIRDLIAYRRKHDHLVHRVGEREFVMANGSSWKAVSFRNRVDGAHHMVLMKGQVEPGRPTLVRMHSVSLFEDILECPGPRRGLLQRSIAAIETEGRGLIVLLRPPDQQILRIMPDGEPAETGMSLRAYGIGAQILAELDVHSMVLLTSAHLNLVAIEGWGISVVEQRPIP